MGKTDKKIKKNKEKLQANEREQRIETILNTAEQLIEEEKYADAINELSQLVKEKCMDPRFMYNCAFCYFMLGDYERAGQWITNTLNVKNDSVKARILLGRICLLQERLNDALALFEYVIDNLAAKIDEEDKEDIESVLEYYGTVEKDLICSEFSGIAKMLGLTVEQEIPEESEKSEIVEEPIKESPEESVNVADDEGENSGQWEKSVDELIEEIMNKDISLIEKVKALNNFAGSYFMLLEYEEAGKLLKAAVKIDRQNMATIRNMAYLLLAQGKGDEALKWAARLPMADFGLLFEMQCQG